jgi:hypothetical protein
LGSLASALVRKVVSKLYVLRRRTDRGKVYVTFFLYLPSKLINDSTFPLKEGDKVSVSIKGNTLVAESISRRKRKRR